LVLTKYHKKKIVFIDLIYLSKNEPFRGKKQNVIKEQV